MEKTGTADELLKKQEIFLLFCFSGSTLAAAEKRILTIYTKIILNFQMKITKFLY